jgi:ribosomal protein L28
MGLYERLRIDGSEAGKRTGKWTQVGASFSLPKGSTRRRFAVYQCECGYVCLQMTEKARINRATHCAWCGPMHGCSREPLYQTWQSMIARCTNQKHEYYDIYGGRGIRVCERWMQSPKNFFDDVGPRPSKKHQLDRIDNDGNYEPGNVRWATLVEQVRNRRCALTIFYDGRSMTLAELSELTGVNYYVLHGRLIRRGWPLEKAIGQQ